MSTATKIIFRRLTESDFYNINSPGLVGGGGQSYIDVSTATVPRQSWVEFLAPAKPEAGAQNRPVWSVAIHSIGTLVEQKVRIGERRKASFNIRAQKIFSEEGNRISAWRPEQGFPTPDAPFALRGGPAFAAMMANLTVYLVRDGDGKIWAGWHNQPTAPLDWNVSPPLTRLFDTQVQDGIIVLAQPIPFHPENGEWPFAGGQAYSLEKTDEESVAGLFDDDEAQDDAGIAYTTQKVRKRNTKAVGPLKKLYGWRCQITGEEFAFETVNGKRYVEAHHLVPLGKGGADKPHNLIVVSAHIHKMLHYAGTSEIDLKKIEGDKLAITIGGKDYTITWHKDHAAKVLAAETDA